jgi:hypothetical protein
MKIINAILHGLESLLFLMANPIEIQRGIIFYIYSSFSSFLPFPYPFRTFNSLSPFRVETVN